MMKRMMEDDEKKMEEKLDLFFYTSKCKTCFKNLEILENILVRNFGKPEGYPCKVQAMEYY